MINKKPYLMKLINILIGIVMVWVVSTALHANVDNCPSVYKVTATQLNVRSQPKIASKILGTVKKNDQICIYRFVGKWGKTEDGWVNNKYLKFSKQSHVGNQQTYLSDKNVSIDKSQDNLAGNPLSIVWTIIFIIGVILFIIMRNNNKGIQNSEFKFGEGTIYDIRDVRSGLKYATRNFFIGILIVYFVGAAALGAIVNSEAGSKIDETQYILAMVGMMGMVTVQSVIIYLVNRRYVIDTETGLITFPRSDMENSIFAIILLFPYWNLMRTKTIHSAEIENIYIDTKRWATKDRKQVGTTSTGKSKYRTETTRHVRYTINLTGAFGSANLPFLDRQKRDEVRNAIQQSVKLHTGKNVDRKVAEF